MSKQILELDILKQFIDIISNCYRLGWDERNGGNISYLLYEDEIAPYLDLSHKTRNVKLDFHAEALAGKYFLVTGSGKYFKNVESDPENNLGIIRISPDGHSYDIIWGFADGGIATSELPTHLMNHIERLKVDKNHRVIFHVHSPYLNAMSCSQDLDEMKITKILWSMISECIIVFPEGIGIIPWEVPGTLEIGKKTAEKMKDVRLVLWPHHGVFASGSTLDDAFGLIETAEKAAEIFTIACQQGGIKQAITDHQLYETAKAFHVTPRKGILNIDRNN